jgi:hypothetical protein
METTTAIVSELVKLIDRYSIGNRSYIVHISSKCMTSQAIKMTIHSVLSTK